MSSSGAQFDAASKMYQDSPIATSDYLTSFAKQCEGKAHRYLQNTASDDDFLSQLDKKTSHELELSKWPRKKYEDVLQRFNGRELAFKLHESAKKQGRFRWRDDSSWKHARRKYSKELNDQWIAECTSEGRAVSEISNKLPEAPNDLSTMRAEVGKMQESVERGDSRLAEFLRQDTEQVCRASKAFDTAMKKMIENWSVYSDLVDQCAALLTEPNNSSTLSNFHELQCQAFTAMNEWEKTAFWVGKTVIDVATAALGALKT